MWRWAGWASRIGWALLALAAALGSVYLLVRALGADARVGRSGPGAAESAKPSIDGRAGPTSSRCWDAVLGDGTRGDGRPLTSEDDAGRIVARFRDLPHRRISS